VAVHPLVRDRVREPYCAGNGWDELDLRQGETRLGFSLPASVRTAYGPMGRRRDLTDAQDGLLSPHQLEIDETGRMLVFRWECQHVVGWGGRDVTGRPCRASAHAARRLVQHRRVERTSRSVAGAGVTAAAAR
jgi:hypothetical protein